MVKKLNQKEKQKNKKIKPYFFCRLNKQQIILSQCKKCSELKYKEIKAIKKKRNKLAKLEKNRFSIITKDLEHCYLCIKQGIMDIPKDDFHELCEGKNRQVSMKYGLVIPICRKCHNLVTNDKTLQDKLHKVAGLKISMQKLVAFLHTNNRISVKINNENNSIYSSIKANKQE